MIGPLVYWNRFNRMLYVFYFMDKLFDIVCSKLSLRFQIYRELASKENHTNVEGLRNHLSFLRKSREKLQTCLGLLGKSQVRLYETFLGFPIHYVLAFYFYFIVYAVQ